MGLAQLFSRSAERAGDPTANQVYYSLPGGFGLTSAAYTGASGIEDALRNAATWACIRVLVDAIARTPINAVRELRGTRTEVNPQPRILVKPSVFTPVDVWRAQLAFSLVTDGNVFGKVMETGPFALPTVIELLDPTVVTDRKVVDGLPEVRVARGKPEKLYPFGDIWHVPGDLVMPGTPFALSPIDYARKIIGTSLAAEDFSYGYFRDGGHPPVALISDTEMGPEQTAEYKQRWQTATRGKREPVVMGSGIEIKELHLDPSETQFIDLMRFMVEQACRFWGVPPTMVFTSIGGQHMTYSNVTQADLHFLKNSLEGKFVRLESAFSELLPGNSFTAPSVPNTIALCDRNAVLKADVKTRNETNQIALENRTKTVNEIRSEEGDPPFDDPAFDLPGVPPFAPTQDPNGVDLGNGMKLVQSATQPAKKSKTGGVADAPGDPT